MSNHHPVMIVGAGQAGLSVSYYLTRAGVEHQILEKNRVAHAWRSQRWDSFCLVTPNWSCRLPGFPYQGDAPHGFMQKDEIVKYVEDFAESFDAPVKESVEVSRITGGGDRVPFELHTSLGLFTADQVVIASGAYQRPSTPRIAETTPKCPGLAMNRPQAARNRLLLYPQLRTFRGPRWTSACDPRRHSGEENYGHQAGRILELSAHLGCEGIRSRQKKPRQRRRGFSGDQGDHIT